VDYSVNSTVNKLSLSNFLSKNLKIRGFLREIKRLVYYAYRFVTRDDCPNWQGLGARTKYRIDEWLNKKNLPAISKEDKVILNNIIENGVYVSTLDKLGFENTENFKKLAIQLFRDTEEKFNVPPTHLGGWFAVEKHTLRPPYEYILKNYPDLIRFALDPRLISIVQHYVGKPAVLLDVDFKIDLPGGNDKGSKVWHYDTMNFKIIKIFIYFTDVTSDSPAFEYIPPRECMKIKKIAFKEMDVYDLTSKENIIRVEAPSESVLFLGVDRILHHLSIPTHEKEKTLRKAVVLHYLAKEVPDRCKSIREGSAGRWGSEEAIKSLKEFSSTLPEELRKYLYIHS
jgi:hypothetical protein